MERFLDLLFGDITDQGDVDDSVPDLSVTVEKLTQKPAQGGPQGL